VIRQRLAEIELSLTYSKARCGPGICAASDQQLLEILGTDFVQWTDLLSYQIGLIIGHRMPSLVGTSEVPRE